MIFTDAIVQSTLMSAFYDKKEGKTKIHNLTY